MKKNIHILIKPASSQCNMRCRYCFYSDVSDHREDRSFGVMQEETVAALIEKTLSYAEGGAVTYAFQGGEPLVAGETFFRRFTDGVAAANRWRSPINYSLQTNGTLLTDSLCAYFKENHYLIGVSLDGPRNIHDENRCFHDGSGSFEAVREGISLLKKHGVAFNILTVVTAKTGENVKKLIQFFENSGFNDLQFITCLEPFGTEPLNSGDIMDEESYFQFHKTIFDWYLRRNRAGKPLSVRHLDNLMNVLHGYRPEMCSMMGYCTGQLVVEGNGNCYPCDFYCDDSHLMGNIQTSSLEELSQTAAMKQFVEESLPVDEACRRCDVVGLCRGGCRRERDIYNDGVLRLNIHCRGRRRFLRYVLSQLGREK